MDGNRRIGLPAIPDDLAKHLNDAQLAELQKVEGFGWSIKYIRRATIVLIYEDGETLGVLEEDGTLNHHAEVRERADTPSNASNDETAAPKSGVNKFIV